MIATDRYGTVIYAAVCSAAGHEVFGLVLLAERQDGVLFTKSIGEDEGPAEDCCPARILDLLSEPSNDHARRWSERCRARLPRGRPRKGQAVLFAEPLRFTDGSEHEVLIYRGGSRFLSEEGDHFHVPSWSTLDYRLGD